MTNLDCAYICTECNGPSNYNCTVCDGGLFFYNSTCLYLCPQGTYANLVTSTCDRKYTPSDLKSLINTLTPLTFGESII